MGFSIGRLLGAVAAPLASLVGGSAGTLLGIGLAGAGAGLTTPVGRQLAPVAAPIVPAPSAPSQLTSIVPTPQGAITISSIVGAAPSAANGFGVTRRRVGLTGLVSRGIGGAFGGAVIAGTILAEILGRARQNTGQRVTKNKIIDSAKHCGIELTADTFGLSETDVCKVIVSGRTRRRRGISAADVRRTKRTLRFVRTIRKDLKAVRL